MGAYDQGSYSSGGNKFSDERQSARDRLLSLLDSQKAADQTAADAARSNAFNQQLGERGDFIGKGLGGASLGMMLGGGPIGAAVGAGLGAVPSLLGGIFGHKKRGEGTLESIINTVGGSIDKTLTNPYAIASAAQLGRGMRKPGSAEDYLSKYTDMGSGTHMAPSGSTYGPAMPSPRFQFSK